MTTLAANLARMSTDLRDAGARVLAAGGAFALWAFAIRVAAALVAFVAQIAIARIVGEGEYGRIAAAVTVLGVAAALAVFGLDVAAQRFVARYRQENDPPALAGFLLFSRALALAVGGAVGIVGAFALAPHDPVLALAFAMLPAMALMMVQEGIAKSFDWPILALAPSYLLRPLLMLALVGAGLALGIGRGATEVMLAMLVATGLVCGVQALMLRPRIAPMLPPDGARRIEGRHWLGVSVPLLVGDVGALVAVSADVIALAWFRSAEEAGIYFAAVKSLALVPFVAYAISNAIAHRVSALHVRGDREALRAMVRRATLATLVPSVVFAAALVALGPFVLGLFGPGFVEAWPAMAIVAAGTVALAAVGPAERVLAMVGAERIYARIYVGAGVLACVLALALVPAYGVIGAASALALTMLAEAIALGLAVRRVLAR